MKKKFLITLFILALFGVVAWAIWFIAHHNIEVLNPKGIIAAKQRDLIWTATWLMLLVVVPVLVMTLAFAWRYRASNTKAKYSPEWSHSHFAEALWWGIPCIIIVALAIITWTSSHELYPFKPLESDKKPLKIQVVALQWKWLFIYPEQGIATVNLVQFPERTPIDFEITADAPMNSFWIPQLGGQIYAMAAMRTKLHLMASEPGEFRGCSANISGTGFAGMTFVAKASSEQEFDSWVQSAKSQGVLGGAEYAELARPSESNPVALYSLGEPQLFEQIIMKYMQGQ